MSAKSPVQAADELVEAPAPVSILLGLPENLQTIPVMCALIRAEHMGYLRRAREAGAEQLANVRLSSSRTQ